MWTEAMHVDGGGGCVNGGGVHVDDDVVCDHFGLELNLRTCKLPPADALTNDCFLMVFLPFFWCQFVTVAKQQNNYAP